MAGQNLGKTALITGASGGIGLELANVFAKNGWNLVLVARNAARLTEIANDLSRSQGVNAHVIVKDLAGKDTAQEIFRDVSARSLRVDALVNNAGIGSFGFFSETDLAVETELLELNVVCLTQLTKLFLKPMVARREGAILNVASTAAFQPGPLMAVYYASKAYVLSFSEAISNELQGSGVWVTALCPGATKTGFQERAQMTRSRLFRHHVMGATEVAEAGYRGFMQKKRIVIPSFKHRLVAHSVRFVPRSWVPGVVRKIQEADRH